MRTWIRFSTVTDPVVAHKSCRRSFTQEKNVPKTGSDKSDDAGLSLEIIFWPVAGDYLERYTVSPQKPAALAPLLCIVECWVSVLATVATLHFWNTVQPSLYRIRSREHERHWSAHGRCWIVWRQSKVVRPLKRSRSVGLQTMLQTWLRPTIKSSMIMLQG